MNREDELGGLWLKTSAAGKRFMSGRLTLDGGEVVEVVVFKNEHKQDGERTPDYRVYRSQPREGGRVMGERRDAPEQRVSPRQVERAVEMQRPAARPSAAEALDDEVPF